MDADEVEVACDESGSEGENLTGARDRVFAHASVTLSVEDAQAVMAEARRLAPSQAQEYKSQAVLRPSGAVAAEWLLAADGPLVGRALVQLVDKEYFVAAKVIDLLVEEVVHAAGHDLYADRRARDLAITLQREGPRALGERWPPLVAAFNSLMRVTQRKGEKTTVEEFFDAVDEVRLRSHRRDVTDVLALLWQAQPHAAEFQTRLLEGPDELPALDPLVATLSQTARTWHERMRLPIRVVHDRQAALTASRAAAIVHGLAHPFPEFADSAPAVRVTAIEQVDSKDDPRVQVADLLAGLARQAATAALLDPDKQAVSLGAFVDPNSLWSDLRSWTALTAQ